MTVHKLYPLGFAANTYFLTADGRNAVAIDPAQPRAAEEAKRLGLDVKYVLLTHGHFDHIGGCAALFAAGAEIGCLKGEEDTALFHNLGREFGGIEVPPFPIGFTVRDGETLSLCGMEIRVIATPGHTSGGACYLAEDKLFSGDTLFAGSVGRCDLPTGSGEALERSVKKLYALAGDYTVYPGHGEDTALSRERLYNGWIRA